MYAQPLPKMPGLTVTTPSNHRLGHLLRGLLLGSRLGPERMFANLLEITARTYLQLGVEHILRGIDHLLFVLALVILVNGARRLFWTITAFTAAHSLTLAAATLGWVHVPPPRWRRASRSASCSWPARSCMRAPGAPA